MSIIKFMEEIDIVVVGAGVVGLAVAAEISKICGNVLVLEKNSSFGQETSSRNSEVIHAGIYYPKDALKTKTCIEGNKLLYQFCADHNIGHRRIGKLIVATNSAELSGLTELLNNGVGNGVSDLRLISQEEIKKLEPNVEAMAAIYSPSTGIIDSHSLMKKLAWQLEENSGLIAYNSEVKVIQKQGNCYRVVVADINEGPLEILSRVVINCAGLNADKISALTGLNKNEYKIKYCKGDYFRVQPIKSRLIQRLVYPLPQKYGSGLGIHATLDLAGLIRLGPDDEYVDELKYDVDPLKAKNFCASVHKFLPFICLEDLSVDTSGIRPKLQGPNEPFRDFIIKDEVDNGFPGLINLIGIESPGLTSCLSIAGMVRNLVKKYLK